MKSVFANEELLWVSKKVTMTASAVTVRDISTFIRKAEIKFGRDAYIFEHTIYIGHDNILIVTCAKCMKNIHISPSNLFRRKYPCDCYYGNMGGSIPLYERRKTFIEAIEERFGINRFSFEKTIYNTNKTPVTITCRSCDTDIEKMAGEFFRLAYPCMTCDFNQACLERRKIFIEKATKRYGDRYSYVNVKYTRYDDEVDIICNKHKCQFSRTIPQFLRDGSICSECLYENVPNSIESFKKLAFEIHGDIYNYDFVEVTRTNQRIWIWCKSCQQFFIQTVSSHIYTRNGCSHCKISKGERCIELLFRQYNIPYYTQFSINKPYRYDFLAFINGRWYIVEYDGEQHFGLGFYKRTEAELEYWRKIDIMKTATALSSGYHVIRIDNKQVNNMLLHLIQGSSSSSVLYLSTPYRYDWLVAGLNQWFGCDLYGHSMRS